MRSAQKKAREESCSLRALSFLPLAVWELLGTTVKISTDYSGAVIGKLRTTCQVIGTLWKGGKI